jgi:hypothetical protein
MPNAAQTLYGLAGVDHWFVAQAVSDLNADGVAATFEATSFTSGIWISTAKGWE